MSSEARPVRLRDFLPAAVLLALSWSLAGWLYPRLPAQVPVHWNAAGEPDRWGGRVEGVLLLPALMTGLVALLALLPRLDPRRPGYASFRRPYLALAHAIPLFLLGVQWVTAAEMLGVSIPMARLVAVGTGLLLALLGAFLPRLRPNWFAGIRTPWTLEDDQVWAATHRLGGRLFVAAGALAVVAGLLAPAGWAIPALVGLALIAGLVPVVYSYLLYRQRHPPG